MPLHCPYCSQSAGESSGDVYCSRHNPSIEAPDTGIFVVRNKEIESGEHYSRFALRFVLKGRHHFLLDGKNYLLQEASLLRFNQQSRYELNIPKQQSACLQVGMAYRTSFIQSATRAWQHTTSGLAEENAGAGGCAAPQEHLLPFNREAGQWADVLLQLAKPGSSRLQLEETAFHLLEWYQLISYKMQQYHTRLHQVAKRSTRDELIRRLERAREIIEYDSFAGPVSQIAAATALSEYHFIRLYRQLYEQTPYQHLLTKKMQRAYRHLSDTAVSVQQAAIETGYDSAAAFTRQFRRYFGISPRDVLQKSR